jgi:osmotically-inducible protein OsmY
MDDKSLRQLIIDELDFEPSISAANIGVAVENGVVTLTGHVASYIEKVTAERAVQRVKGVRGLAEEIQVRYPEHKKTADDQIARRALDIMSWDARVPDGAVKVSVEKGWVTLTGLVDWHFQKDAATSAVRRLGGVTGVTNRIEVRAHAYSQDVKSQILAALKRNAELEADAIRVNVIGDKVMLEGNIKVWSERNLVERAARSVPGVKSVEDNLRVV